jgi:hypothetical protein
MSRFQDVFEAVARTPPEKVSDADLKEIERVARPGTEHAVDSSLPTRWQWLWNSGLTPSDSATSSHRSRKDENRLSRRNSGRGVASQGRDAAQNPDAPVV